VELIKVLILGLIIAVISVVLKQIKPEYSIICIIIGSILLLIYILDAISGVISFFLQIVNRTGINSDMFSILLKIIGVGYLIEFASGICIDSGNSSLAEKIVIAGKLLIFTISMPIVNAVFNLVMELVKL